MTNFRFGRYSQVMVFTILWVGDVSLFLIFLLKDLGLERRYLLIQNHSNILIMIVEEKVDQLLEVLVKNLSRNRRHRSKTALQLLFEVCLTQCHV